MCHAYRCSPPFQGKLTIFLITPFPSNEGKRERGGESKEVKTRVLAFAMTGVFIITIKLFQGSDKGLQFKNIPHAKNAWRNIYIVAF